MDHRGGVHSPPSGASPVAARPDAARMDVAPHARPGWAQGFGLITRSEAVDAFGEGPVDRRLRSGRWQRVLPGVYRTRDVEDQPVLAAAALLYGGPRAQLGAATACGLLGVRDVPMADGVQLLTPATRRPGDQEGVSVHTTVRLPCPVHVGPAGTALAVSPLVRATVDAARGTMDLRAVRALLCEVVHARRVPIEDLAIELRAGPRGGRALVNRVLDELRAGAQSAPEAEARDLFSRSRLLPPPLLNATVLAADGRFLGRPDGLFWSSGTAYEVDSRRHHAAADDWERTMARRRRFEAAGIRVVAFSPRQLRDDGPRLLAQVEAVHLAGLPSGPPPGLRLAAAPDRRRATRGLADRQQLTRR